MQIPACMWGMVMDEIDTCIMSLVVIRICLTVSVSERNFLWILVDVR